MVLLKSRKKQENLSIPKQEFLGSLFLWGFVSKQGCVLVVLVGRIHVFIDCLDHTLISVGAAVFVAVEGGDAEAVIRTKETAGGDGADAGIGQEIVIESLV